MITPNRFAKLKGNKVEISFPYDPDILRVIKDIPGRSYVPATKIWTVPATPWHFDKVCDLLTPLGFSIDQDIATKADHKSPPPKHKYIKGLYPFQRLAVDFIYYSGGRAILADEMGLGKTVSALAFVDSFAGRTLVVCPANVVYKWGEEVERWTPDKTYQIIETGKDKMKESDITIMSYGMAVSHFEKLMALPLDMIIFDEAHYLKSYKAKRTKAAKLLVRNGANKLLFLSGTPFMNRPDELFSLVNMIDPSGFPNFYSFAVRYCGAQKIMGYWMFPNKVTNATELATRLKRIMIRRTKQDVEMDIPELTRTSVPVKLSNMTDYNRALIELRGWLKSKGKSVMNPSHVLTKLTVLRQIVGEGKVDASAELAEQILQGGRKVVLFAHHKDVVAKLTKKLEPYGMKIISGDVAQKERDENVKAFQKQDSGIRVMIITMAGGIGIDLYSAADIIFVEREWTPAIEEQAEARLQRFGQKNPVTAWYVVAKRTVDEKLDRVVRQKRAIIGSVIKQDEVLEAVISEIQKGDD